VWLTAGTRIPGGAGTRIPGLGKGAGTRIPGGAGTRIPGLGKGAGTRIPGLGWRTRSYGQSPRPRTRAILVCAAMGRRSAERSGRSAERGGRSAGRTLGRAEAQASARLRRREAPWRGVARRRTAENRPCKNMGKGSRGSSEELQRAPPRPGRPGALANPVRDRPPGPVPTRDPVPGPFSGPARPGLAPANPGRRGVAWPVVARPGPSPGPRGGAVAPLAAGARPHWGSARMDSYRDSDGLGWTRMDSDRDSYRDSDGLTGPRRRAPRAAGRAGGAAAAHRLGRGRAAPPARRGPSRGGAEARRRRFRRTARGAGPRRPARLRQP
jgi:hypothetical protein